VAPRLPARVAQSGRAAASRQALGKRAEEAVADYLIVRGYSILAQNLRVGRFEIDVLARLGAVVAVVEVRTRGPRSFLPALATLSRAKQDHLLAAADRLWQDRFAQTPEVAHIRIDVAAVYFHQGTTRVEYLEGAIAHR
jgi:putative endonuclease